VSDAPDYPAPLYGWRLWLVVPAGDSLALASIVYDVVWPVGEPLVAECLHARRSSLRPWRTEQAVHDVPFESCRCGIYAIDDPLRLGSYLDGAYPGRIAMHRVIGRVALWGTVVESDRGWRASYAYPAHLYVPLLAGEPRSTAAVAGGLAAYGVPVDSLAERETPDVLALLAERWAA
jgi:hypothetical protein